MRHSEHQAPGKVILLDMNNLRQSTDSQLITSITKCSDMWLEMCKTFQLETHMVNRK